jgi:hypothetical protein
MDNQQKPQTPMTSRKAVDEVRCAPEAFVSTTWTTGRRVRLSIALMLQIAAIAVICHA